MVSEIRAQNKIFSSNDSAVFEIVLDNVGFGNVQWKGSYTVTSFLANKINCTANFEMNLRNANNKGVVIDSCLVDFSNSGTGYYEAKVCNPGLLFGALCNNVRKQFIIQSPRNISNETIACSGIICEGKCSASLSTLCCHKSMPDEYELPSLRGTAAPPTSICDESEAENDWECSVPGDCIIPDSAHNTTLSLKVIFSLPPFLQVKNEYVVNVTFHNTGTEPLLKNISLASTEKIVNESEQQLLQLLPSESKNFSFIIIPQHPTTKLGVFGYPNYFKIIIQDSTRHEFLRHFTVFDNNATTCGVGRFNIPGICVNNVFLTHRTCINNTQCNKKCLLRDEPCNDDTDCPPVEQCTTIDSYQKENKEVCKTTAIDHCVPTTCFNYDCVLPYTKRTGYKIGDIPALGEKSLAIFSQVPGWDTSNVREMGNIINLWYTSQSEQWTRKSLMKINTFYAGFIYAPLQVHESADTLFAKARKLLGNSSSPDFVVIIMSKESINKLGYSEAQGLNFGNGNIILSNGNFETRFRVLAHELAHSFGCYDFYDHPCNYEEYGDLMCPLIYSPNADIAGLETTLGEKCAQQMGWTDSNKEGTLDILQNQKS